MPIVFTYLAEEINQTREELNKELVDNPRYKNFKILNSFKYKIIEDDSQTIKMQFLALKLIELSKTENENSSIISFVKLSKYSERRFIELRAVSNTYNQLLYLTTVSLGLLSFLSVYLK